MGLWDRARGFSRVVMTKSVSLPDGRVFVSGQAYWLRPDLADSFVLKEYARGGLTRDYSEDEIVGLRSGSQTVNLSTGEVSDGLSGV